MLDENSFPADHHFAAGEQTYTITLKKLVAVTPHGNGETESIIEQLSRTMMRKLKIKRESLLHLKAILNR